jgi:hypothetical protein
MLGDEKYIWIIPAGCAVVIMAYSGFAYYLRLKSWKRMDASVVDCSGSLNGDNNIVYKCLIELNNADKTELFSVTSGLSERKKGERVTVMVNPRNSRDLDMVDTKQKLVGPFIGSAIFMWTIGNYHLDIVAARC